LAAIRPASARAAATTAAASACTEFTSPIACARSAAKSSPVSASSAASPRPMIPGRRCSVPTSATIAMRVSRIEKIASADASRMSHAVIRSTPPPMQ